jgi:hypothetical protein
MGRYCKICERSRPNERFRGKGRRRFICRDCLQLPKEELHRIECVQEIWGYWEQSNISKKNMQRLEKLTRSPESPVAELASLVLAAARLKPGKRRRFKFLASQHRDLLNQLIRLGLYCEYLDDEYADEDDVSWDDAETEANFHTYFGCGRDLIEDRDAH